MKKSGGTHDYELVQNTVDLQAEVKRFDEKGSFKTLDIELRTFWTSISLLQSKHNRSCVLLTGATGFLGAFLLQVSLL